MNILLLSHNLNRYYRLSGSFDYTCFTRVPAMYYCDIERDFFNAYDGCAFE